MSQNRNSFIDSTKPSDERLEALKRLYPELFADGRLNADVLKEIATGENPQEERTPGYYGLYWPGKHRAKIEAKASPKGTLEMVPGDGVDEDTTHNIYIEGDNLEVLRILRQSYKGRVKMIYIDPPYNTGNDFIYPDDYRMPVEEYKRLTGQTDEKGNALTTNQKSNGAFHTNWLNMMLPRLMLARELLTEDGVIFISIDDNEQANLKLLCDEVFGEENALTPFIWPLPRGINAGIIARAHEYILVYAKNLDNVGNFNKVSNNTEYSIERCNKKIDSRHPASSITFPAGVPYDGKDQILEGTIGDSEKITIIGKMIFKNGKLEEPVTVSAGWTMKNMILDWLAGKKVYDLKGQEIIDFFFKENGRLYSKKNMTTISIKSILNGVPDTQYARKEMENLFGNQDIFPYPKTTELPKLFAKLSTPPRQENSISSQVSTENQPIILDFFSGSATTAHAVMKLNAEDGGKRKFIMVQLPQACDENSEAFKAGYKNICEIGKERIRRAGKLIINNGKLKASNPKENSLFDKQTLKQVQGDGSSQVQHDGISSVQADVSAVSHDASPNSQPSTSNSQLSPVNSQLDVGFKVFRLKESNFTSYAPPSGQDAQAQSTLFAELEKNQTPLVEGWKAQDVLTEIILKQGFALDCDCKKLESFTKNTVYRIEDSHDATRRTTVMYVCLDPKIQSDTIASLALGEKEKFVCLDSAIDDTSYARLADKGRIETI